MTQEETDRRPSDFLATCLLDFASTSRSASMRLSAEPRRDQTFLGVGTAAREAVVIPGFACCFDAVHCQSAVSLFLHAFFRTDRADDFRCLRHGTHLARIPARPVPSQGKVKAADACYMIPLTASTRKVSVSSWYLLICGNLGCGHVEYPLIDLCKLPRPALLIGMPEGLQSLRQRVSPRSITSNLLVW